MQPHPTFLAYLVIIVYVLLPQGLVAWIQRLIGILQNLGLHVGGSQDFLRWFIVVFQVFDVVQHRRSA
ncbi:MAG: hypothetical protein BWY72_02510 [Bacteroidetes bacterium ADurb.Bin416]|nr:MAG: hypothetical protein BWY72_02510 [Bacteroidetes bacterium ADurb.Bin416]